MKKSIFLPLLFSFCCVSSVSFCMQNDQLVPVNNNAATTFTCFNVLPKVLQEKTFACAEPCDKNNWRVANKEWHTIGTIQRNDFFTPSIFRIMRHSPLVASKKDKLFVWEYAIWSKDRDLEDNIWNNTSEKDRTYMIQNTYISPR